MNTLQPDKHPCSSTNEGLHGCLSEKQNHTDPRGKAAEMSFEDYINQVAIPGTWAGRLEAEAAAEALKIRLLIYTSWGEIFDLNPEGHDTVCTFYNQVGHWELVEGADVQRWVQRKRRH